MKRITLLLLLLSCNTLISQELTELQKNIISATTETKKSYHVVFQETADKKKDSGYFAKVELFVNDNLVGTFRGSTFPNSTPSSNRPDDWIYTIVMSKSDMYQSVSEDRYYLWKREKRSNGDACLRFNQNGKVPAINISSERFKNDMDSWDKQQYKLVYELLSELNVQDPNYPFFYATTILIHKGFTQYIRGSAGCLTIHPDDEKNFFDLIPMNTQGTCEIIRTQGN
ncbi:MAG: hypothetical protein Aureis2KO_05580 [Aureisphaera sp.]